MVSSKYALLLALAVILPLVNATAPFTMSLSSNTLYQNTNSSPLGIYVTTHSAPLMGYLGNTTSLIKVIDLRGGSVTITGNVYSLTGYNMSAYMLVEPDEYYKFNFTNATFVGQYNPPTTQSKAAETILLPEYGQNEYAGGALILFAIGLLMYISMILYAFTNMLPKSKNPTINMLFLFSLGLTTVAVLIFSAFYQVQLSIPPYQIISGNSTATIQVHTIRSIPLAKSTLFGPIIMLLSITAALLSLVLPAYYFIESWRRKKYKVR